MMSQNLISGFYPLQLKTNNNFENGRESQAFASTFTDLISGPVAKYQEVNTPGSYAIKDS
jgi:hypothetical protein